MLKTRITEKKVNDVKDVFKAVEKEEKEKQAREAAISERVEKICH
jgi:hypothetical protein